jgi:hypothetical protein
MKKNTISTLILAVLVALPLVSYIVPSKKCTSTTYYLNESQVSSAVIGSLSSDITNLSAWSSMPNSFGNGTKLAAITFDEDNVADGGDDDAWTLSEALDLVYDYYLNNSNTLPGDGELVCSWECCPNKWKCTIIIRRKW